MKNKHKAILSSTMFFVILFSGSYVSSLTDKQDWYQFPILVSFSLMLACDLFICVFAVRDMYVYGGDKNEIN